MRERIHLNMSRFNLLMFILFCVSGISTDLVPTLLDIYDALYAKLADDPISATTTDAHTNPGETNNEEATKHEYIKGSDTSGVLNNNGHETRATKGSDNKTVQNNNNLNRLHSSVGQVDCEPKAGDSDVRSLNLRSDDAKLCPKNTSLSTENRFIDVHLGLEGEEMQQADGEDTAGSSGSCLASIGEKRHIGNLVQYDCNNVEIPVNSNGVRTSTDLCKYCTNTVSVTSSNDSSSNNYNKCHCSSILNSNKTVGSFKRDSNSLSVVATASVLSSEEDPSVVKAGSSDPCSTKSNDMSHHVVTHIPPRSPLDPRKLPSTTTIYRPLSSISSSSSSSSNSLPRSQTAINTSYLASVESLVETDSAKSTVALGSGGNAQTKRRERSLKVRRDFKGHLSRPGKYYSKHILVAVV